MKEHTTEMKLYILFFINIVCRKSKFMNITLLVNKAKLTFINYIWMLYQTIKRLSIIQNGKVGQWYIEG